MRIGDTVGLTYIFQSRTAFFVSTAGNFLFETQPLKTVTRFPIRHGKKVFLLIP